MKVTITGDPIYNLALTRDEAVALIMLIYLGLPYSSDPTTMYGRLKEAYDALSAAVFIDLTERHIESKNWELMTRPVSIRKVESNV